MRRRTSDTEIIPLRERNWFAMALALIFLVLLGWVLWLLFSVITAGNASALIWAAFFGAIAAFFLDVIALVTGDIGWFLISVIVWGDRR